MQKIDLLRQVAEQDFIAYLKLKDPEISQDDINSELRIWYRARPGAEHGDAVGRIGDPSRFNHPADISHISGKN